MTPCNTPATPPNFPDTLIAFSRMTTTSENSKLGSSPSKYKYFYKPYVQVTTIFYEKGIYIVYKFLL